ncbi:TonB-dependent receptor [Wenzhouxiangellaceae bacterium CH-27]|uniref:TonB-dependent receptor n=1 Tax=Elongatibacter sediminis TaxID=3119006 RepID=A0AAW9RDL2_9GAMM
MVVAQSALEEVIVTAQKREQSLQDVGISVTALSGESIRSYGFSNVLDVLAKVPGVDSYSPYGTGTSANIVIRGIGLNDFGEGHEAPIATYVDEFYLVSVPAVDFALFDLERVEFLRGPQGTLFGRNATGGLAHFITAKPTQEFNGFASLEVGNFSNLKFEAAAGGPISDTTSFRVAVLSHNRDGYVENLNPELDDGGEAGNTAIRAQLLFEPGNDWSVLLKGEHSKIDTVHSYYEQIPLNFDPVSGLSSLNPNGTDFAGYNEQDFGGGDRNVTYTSDPQEMDQEGTHFLARIEKDFGEYSFTSLTGYYDVERNLVEDCDASPNVICFAEFPYQSDWFTQELRIGRSSGDFQWTAGVYYLSQDATNQPAAVFNVPLDGPGAVDPSSGLYNGAFFPIALSGDWIQDTQSYSAFGHIEYAFAPEWTFTAGFRWTHDKKDFLDQDNASLRSCPGFPIPSNCFLPPDGPGIPNPYEGNYDDDLYSWRLQLDYEPADGVLVYASVSQGTKAGGFNNGFLSAAAASDTGLIPYGDEKNIAFEVGEKATFLDGRLRLNGSVFYYDYSDFQTFNWVGIGGLIVNSDATAYGGEMEVQALLTDNLSMQLGFSYLDTEIEDVVGPSASYVADREMANAPEITASGTFVYDVPLGGNYDLRLQWDFNYISERYANNFNDPSSELDSYFKHNALVTLGLGENWKLQAYVRNISDKEHAARMFVFSDLGYGQFMYAQPRTYGLNLTYTY